MVSAKSFTLFTLSVSTATAFPKYRHARFHMPGTGTGVSWPQPTGGEGHHHHHHNETDTGFAGPTGAQPVAATVNFTPPEASAAASNVAGASDVEQPTAVIAAVNAGQSSSCTSLSTFTQYVTSTDIATVTARAAVAEAAADGGWYRPSGGNGWGYSQWSSAAPAAETTFVTSAAPAPASSQAPAVSVGISMGGGASASSVAPAPSASSGSTGSGTSSGGKKGLSYNTPSLLNIFSGADASWAYNWGAGAGGSLPSGVEYVPMLWGQSGVSAWSSAVNSAISSGAKHVLSFNEPDLGSQANIDPQTAAKLHLANITPLSGKVQTGSPAITNSAQAGQGLEWMKSFLGACGANNGCKIDFMALHWYNNPGTFSDFQNHITSALQLAQANGIQKVWITEFAINGSENDQATFLAQALPWLESQSGVERYAYFMAANGQMLTNGALNAVGKAYAG